MILALDSVFEQCSVALLHLDGSLIDETTLLGNRLQTQQILPLISTLMQQHGIDFSQLTAIAFDRGPGAFSGIRINTAVAQALAFAHDLPCLPISSLQAVAQLGWVTHELTKVCVALDARMQQVYAGEFAESEHIMQPIGSAYLADYDSVLTHDLPILGNGANLLSSRMTQARFTDLVPGAAIIGQLGATLLAQGGGVPAEQALPVYLRHNAWKTLAEQGKTH